MTKATEQTIAQTPTKIKETTRNPTSRLQDKYTSTNVGDIILVADAKKVEILVTVKPGLLQDD